MVRKVLLSSMCMTVAALMIRAAVAPAQEQRSPAPRQQMVWVDRGGNVLKNIGDSQAIITGPILSPDGNMIAVRGRNVRDGDDDIWVYDLRRNIKFQATMHPSNERQPAWSPNGRSIVSKRALPESCGVRPPCPNQLCATTTVRPAARKLIATPEISWLPLKVIEARP